MLAKAAGISKGSGSPNLEKVGSISNAQLKEIANVKLPDLNTSNIDKAMQIVSGTAKNMGIDVSN